MDDAVTNRAQHACSKNKGHSLARHTPRGWWWSSVGSGNRGGTGMGLRVVGVGLRVVVKTAGR